MDTKDHLRILQRANYEAIEYWTEEEYLKEASNRKKSKGPATMVDAQALRGGKRLAEDENVMYWFVQREDGSTVEGSVLKQARAHARKIFIYLHSRDLAPPRWNDASSLARSYYASEMRFVFPELGLCEHDYKSHRIATMIYPGWYATYNNSISKKIEPDVLEDAAAAVVAGDAKRPAPDSPDEQPLPKKLKAEKLKPKSKPRRRPAVPTPLATAPATASTEPSSHPSDLPPIPASDLSDVAAKPSMPPPQTIPSTSLSSSLSVISTAPPAAAAPSTVAESLSVTIPTSASTDPIVSAAQPPTASAQVPSATGSTVDNPL